MSSAPGGDLRPGWSWLTVADIAADEPSSITDGPFGSNLKTEHYTQVGPRVVRLTNIGDGVFVDAKAHISQDHFERLQKHRVEAGDLLIAALGETLPRACVAPTDLGPAIVKADCIRVRVKPIHSASYLRYALIAPPTRRRVGQIIHGVGRPRLNLQEIKAIQLPVAPPEEQPAIVAEIETQFSRLDAAVAALKRAQANLKRCRASVLKAACEGRLVPTEAELARREGRSYETGAELLARVLEERRRCWNGRGRYVEPKGPDTAGLAELPEGWVWATAAQLASKIVDGVHKKPAYVTAGIPFVTVRNLTAGPGISFEKLKYIAEKDHLEFIKRANPERGDILISKDGTLGVVRLVETDTVFSIFVSVALVKPADRTMSRFLSWATQSPQVQLQMVPKGSGLQHIHLEDLREDCIPVPPQAEQERIVAEVERRLSALDAAEKAVAAGLQRAARLRQAVLARAFSGEG